MSITVITGPSAEPLSLDEAKLHLRVSGTAEDALITSMIKAARQKMEIDTRRCFCTQTVQETMDHFPRPMLDERPDRFRRFALSRQPVQAVTSIAYLDTAGQAQTLEPVSYKVTVGEPTRIALKYGYCWPWTLCEADAVTVTYTAGFGDALAVPEFAKAAMRLIIGHLYENREEIVVGNITAVQMPLGAKAIADSLRWGDYR